MIKIVDKYYALCYSIIIAQEVIKMINTIMNQMAEIEKKQKKMFHEIDEDLEKKIFDAIDSKNKARINEIIKILDELL